MTSPLSKEQAMSLSNSLCLSNATTHGLVSNMATELVAIGTGQHVVVAAATLAALREYVAAFAFQSTHDDERAKALLAQLPKESSHAT